MPRLAPGGPCLFQLLSHAFDHVAIIDQRKQGQQTFLVERRERVAVRYFEKQVEVV